MSRPHHFTRLILVRHAQARTADGTYGSDSPLSDLGIQQVRLLSRGLPLEVKPAALYCSPLARAVQTAEPLAHRWGLALRADGRLAEFQMDPAPLDPEAACRIWQPQQRGREDGETVAEFFHRVAEFCTYACQRHEDQAVAMVTHAGTIDAVYRWALDVASENGWTFEVEVPNASVSEIQMWPSGKQDGGAPRLAVLHRTGDVRHLEGCVSAT